jgi:hypothetical protein
MLTNQRSREEYWTDEDRRGRHALCRSSVTDRQDTYCEYTESGSVKSAIKVENAVGNTMVDSLFMASGVERHILTENRYKEDPKMSTWIDRLKASRQRDDETLEPDRALRS